MQVIGNNNKMQSGILADGSLSRESRRRDFEDSISKRDLLLRPIVRQVNRAVDRNFRPRSSASVSGNRIDREVRLGAQGSEFPSPACVNRSTKRSGKRNGLDLLTGSAL